MGVSAIVAVGAVVLQLARPGPTNPPVEPGLALEDQTVLPPRIADLMRRACYDCHSHETRWPWYARVAPASWLVVRDVERGRHQLNFSRWGDENVYVRADLLDAACQLVSDGVMPLPAYRLMHPRARLTEDDIAGFCAWTREEAARLVAPPSP